MVSKYQHAFIQNRQILDAALIANEAVDFRLKDNLSGLLLKLAIEKALIMSTGTAFCQLCLGWGLGKGGLIGLDGASPQLISQF